MTIVRLADGGLFVHSPVALTPATRNAVDGLGRVAAIVAPSRFHHLYVRAWADAFPDAPIFGCPGQGTLSDTAEPIWERELRQVFFAARPRGRSRPSLEGDERERPGSNDSP